MKFRTQIPLLIIVLFISLAGSTQAVAQTTAKNHRHYQLIDLGTLGGPDSYLTAAFFEGLTTQSLSAAGTLAGAADTAIPDPYPDFCFNADCMVGHAVQWQGGSLTDLGTLSGTGDLNGQDVQTLISVEGRA